MKISSASKKVLASALSAAMVVAFSPAVALGATNTGGNAYYTQDDAHTLDNGVVTKAPTCAEDGTMTYTCKDGDGHTVTAVIPATGVHNYSLDTKAVDTLSNVAYKDGVNWGGYTAGTAAIFLTCANGDKVTVVSPASTYAGTEIGDRVTADSFKLTPTVTAPTFYSEGSEGYSIEVKYNNQTFTATKAAKTTPAYSIDGLEVADYTTNTVFTDGGGVARIKMSNSDGDVQILSAATTSKVTKAATESDKGETTYTAVFDLPEGVFFAGDITSNISSAAAASVSVNAGKLTVVSKPFEDVAIVKDHIAATAGTVGAAGVTITAADTGAQTPEKVTGNGVTITYSGAGEIAKGTAAEDGAWTFAAKCTGHGTETAVKEQVATKVTKASCVKAGKKTVVYTIEYAGGSYKLTVPNIATTEADGHTYVAQPTKWSKAADGVVSAEIVYVCPVDNSAIRVTMKSDKTVYNVKSGNWNPATGVFTATGSAITDLATDVVDGSKKASCSAKGALAYDLTLKADGADQTNFNALVKELGVTPTASMSVTTPKLAHNTEATVKFVGNDKAIVNVVCAGKELSVVKTLDLTAKHVNATLDAKTGTVTAGYTDYTADLNLADFGVTKITTLGTGVFYDAKTDTYSVKKTVTDDATVSIYDTLNAQTGLPGSSVASAWTVTDRSSGTAKTYAATAVSVADIACDKTVPYERKAYTLTYDNGKTVTVECKGYLTAHKYEVKYYEFEKEQDAYGRDILKTVTPIMVCSDCGREIKGEKITFNWAIADAVKTNTQKKAVSYKYSMNDAASTEKTVVVGDVTFGKFFATGVAYTTAPTFKWDSTFTITNNWVMPSCEATFVSADGKWKVTVDCDVTLADAATNTYKATVPASAIPEGYSGGVLSDTKVINLHEGHAMVLEKVEKATTSKAGIATYYCNNDGLTYKVAIAKNNMKVSPTSKSFKASALKKAKKTFAIKVTNAKGAVSYKSGSKQVTVSSKGKVTVKKGTKKGTYKVTVTSKATSSYAKVTKTVSIKVK